MRMIKSRRVRWVGHISCMGEMTTAYNIFVGKHKWKRLLGRPRHRWEDNVILDLGEIG
jgi:hypothetical protein